MENSLNKIIVKKEQKLIELKKTISIEYLKEKINENKNFINFKEKIENNIINNKISLIAEIKKASPSAGTLVEKYNPIEIGKNYLDGGASCLSILTEEKFFHGKLDHINEVKSKIKLPVLCKDFFIDTFQVPLAKSYGADAILIILAGVSDDLANNLYQEALKLDMSVIVEVHTVEEAQKALNFKDALIGINNRKEVIQCRVRNQER